MIWIKRFFPGGALRSFVRSLPFETARHARGDATSWASSDSIRAQKYDFFGERAKNQPFIPFVRPKIVFFGMGISFFRHYFQSPLPICIVVTHHYRRIGGSESGNIPSVHHPKAQRRGQTVEHMHQAMERRHALPQAKGRHRAANQHAARGIGRTVAGMNENALTAGHLHQARQSRPPGRRPPTGRAGKSWRNHIEPERIFAGGDGRMRPRRRRFERSDGRLSALGGKKQHPLRAPGQVGGAAQKNQCRHQEKMR